MKVEYYPKRDSNWNVIRDVGFSVILPDNYNNLKKWPLEMAVHGIGERSAGTQADVENLVLGYDYNGDGVREGPAFVTDDMKKAVDIYGIVLVIPSYETTQFFEPAMVNYVYDFVQSKYSVVAKMLLTGFSYGGGAVVKYITSGSTNTGRVAYAVPCAPVSAIVNASIPGILKLPVHFFVNDKDTNAPTNLSVTKDMVTKLNASNPAIPALYTAFRRDGHGGNVEAWSLTPPKAPLGQGFIDAAENIYQVYVDILANGPRQMKSGTVIDPAPDTPPAGLTPVLNLSEANGRVQLDGRASSGYKSATLACISVPAGENKYAYNINGGGTEVGWIQLSKAGSYVFRLTIWSGAGYTGTAAMKDVTFNYGGGTAPAPFKPTHTITYADGRKEEVQIGTL